MTGNAVMSRMVRELVARTSLIIGLFGASGLSNCREEEHAGILTAIKQKDTELAVARAREHLDHIEAELDLTTGSKDQIDLQAILQD